MKYLYHLLATLVGGLFVFSGLIKLNDPIGTSLKMSEYFQVFATDFTPFFNHFIPYSLPFAIFICVIEVVLGLSLIVNFKKYFTLNSLLLLVIFFGFLTYYSAAYNKVTDCGCFGDAIKLTPWESFYKDMILLGAISLLLLISAFIKKEKNDAPSPIPAYITLVGTLASLFGAYYVLAHEPLIDFRPYKVGNSIIELRKPTVKPIYEYVMLKDGKEVVYKEYPQDSTLTYKSYRLVNAEDSLLFLPKILDYNFSHPTLGDFTEESLKGAKLMLIIQNVSKSNKEAFEKINALTGQLKDVTPFVVTADNEDVFKQFANEVGLKAPYYFGDEKVLKTIIRCNPGLMLIKDGIVKGKWHYNDTPEAAEIEALLK